MSNLPPQTPMPSSAASTGEPDPFLSLHKMSTTAGLGSADYVAINGTAIATILLGIVSSLALFQNNLLLLIPLAGLVCGVIAFVQINHSNGTQTGRMLAGLGMLMSLGFGGYVVASEAYSASANRADQNQVVELITKFSDAIKSDQYASAYQLTDDSFRSHTSELAFTDRFKSMNGMQLLGHVSKIESNGHMEFDTDPVTGQRLGSTYVKLSYAKVPDPERTPVIFHKGDNGWLISSMPDVFQPDQASAAGRTGLARAAKGPVEPAGPPAPK